MLNADQLDRLSRGICPDCSHSGFRLGPFSGFAWNIACMGCGHRFNVIGTRGWQLKFAERIDGTRALDPEHTNRWQGTHS